MVLAVAVPSAIQQPAADGVKPAFEIASVKPNTSGNSGRGVTLLQPGGGLVATNVTLRELVAFANQRYPFDQREVTGGPPWVDSDRFDVVAKATGEHVVDPDGAPRQTLLMLRTLLAERFKLKAHEENRDRSVYLLMMATAEGTLGLKLRQSDIDCGAVMKGQRPAMQPGQGPPCGFKTPPGRLFANTFTMPAIASLISRHVDRPVVDRTGLEGRFDIELEAAEIKPPADYKPGPSDLALPPAAGPSIFVAVREQLGLKLEPQFAPVAVLVIDHAERPSAN
ncbi:MAG: TIGR03435 family protein [Acidobacteria bacterium]|nr:TIGR03435 family protein [Acidobacteriota bacterium]